MTVPRANMRRVSMKPAESSENDSRLVPSEINMNFRNNVSLMIGLFSGTWSRP
jgi:hypothetical protein